MCTKPCVFAYNLFEAFTAVKSIRQVAANVNNLNLTNPVGRLARVGEFLCLREITFSFNNKGQ